LCGFVGCVSPEDRSRQVFGTLHLLRHRGPDDSGFYVARGSRLQVALAHQRLSIIDLNERSRQPLGNEDGTVLVCYNGEIYNFRALRHELQAHGHEFRTESDTEVIVHGYDEWGERVCERLEGMFAFALWDARQERLLLARDHFGVKPLYYAPLPGAGIAFASEIKALLAMHPGRQELDAAALGKYLAFLWIPHPGTPFRAVRKLPPATCAVFDAEGFHQREYWDLTFRDGAAPPEPVDQLDQLLQEAVTKRLVSDVPLGVFLSGGVDSSLVTAVGAKVSTAPLLTVTAAFTRSDLAVDPLGDDALYAALVRRQLGSRLTGREVTIEADAAQLLHLLAWHCDDPVADPAILPAYLLAKAAKPIATVMLSGVGAEEVFGGYPRYVAGLLSTRYERVPQPLQRVLRSLADRWGNPRGGGLFRSFRRLRKFLNAAELPFPARFIRYRSYFEPSEVSALLGTSLDSEELLEEHLQYWNRVADRPLFDRMCYLDIKTYLPCLNLAYADRASMAASLELREPMLDLRLTEFVAGLPQRWRIHGRQTKVALKELARRYLPRQVVDRAKVGFGSPVRAWLRGPLRHLTADLLSPAAIRQTGILDAGVVRQIVAAESHEDWAMRVWTLLNLQAWSQTVLRGTPAAAPPVAVNLA